LIVAEGAVKDASAIFQNGPPQDFSWNNRELTNIEKTLMMEIQLIRERLTFLSEQKHFKWLKMEQNSVLI